MSITLKPNGFLKPILLGILLLLCAAPLFAAGEGSGESLASARAKAEKAMKNNNYKDALEIYQRLALDTANDPARVGGDLQTAIQCLANLNRIKEADDLLEKTVAAHKANWRLLRAAAQTYLYGIDHNGSMIEGKFERGQHRGRAKYAHATDRDRVRGLQLMVEAMKISRPEEDRDKSELASFYQDFANILLNGRYGQEQGWRLQTLTDFAQLPDYEEGYPYYYGGQTQGAPVDEKGEPVFYGVPESFESAASDGERWRWCLAKSVQLYPGYQSSADSTRASFLLSQFGVQTLQQFNWFMRGQDSGDDSKNESGTYALHTLGDDETIARLATGIRRFKLPPDQNYIKLYESLKDYENLARIYENRRQYKKALDNWAMVLENLKGNEEWVRQRRKEINANMDQIRKNWCRFEPVMTQPAGEKGATVEMVFRNGKKASFVAHEIQVKELLDDVRKYIESRPKQLDWEKMNIGDIGWMLVAKNQTKYIGKKAAEWDMALEPRANHFDRRVTVQTPLKKAGAYLLKANMEDGNESRVLIWVADTAIVRKPLSDKSLYFIADASNGKPLEGMKMEFFGHRMEYKGNNNTEIIIKKFDAVSNADGLVINDPDTQPANMQYIVTASDGKRLAFLGFSHIWYNRMYDAEYNQTKIIALTDRPVYRPSQTVKFKFWIRKAKYDQEDTSDFANHSFNLEIRNPKGDKALAQTFQADEFGGFDGELALPADAPLGVYTMHLPGQSGQYGGSTFRVEEYKKPEFEVKIEAPAEPVALGEKIPATVKAKYYFGSPVAKGKVKIKVNRSDRETRWYPGGIWDWFYGPGYWWFACDYAWYPGWRAWGCWRPIPWWWHTQKTPPELVLEMEKPIGPDGTLKIEIDSALAKAFHGDTDHEYSITAEVTDESRRTITGTGSVIAARNPFKVYAWVDRGHYRAGDTVRAEFSAQTVDNKPVQGKGVLHLYKITYAPDKKKGGELQPVEKSVQKWSLDTNAQGRAAQQIQANEPGQFRLSYEVTDTKGHKIEGGYVFTVMGDKDQGGDFRFNAIEIVPEQKEYKPGDKARVRVNVNKKGGTVLLFVRAANGLYPEPKVLRLSGKSALEEIEITKKEMPNFFIEAVTVSDGRMHVETKEIVVPPEQRVLNLEVKPSKTEYKPGEKGKIEIKLTDLAGKPVAASLALSVYDKAVEYISGGSNIPEIKAFFWKWRRGHNPNGETSLERGSGPLSKENEVTMQPLGIFGNAVPDEMLGEDEGLARNGKGGKNKFAMNMPPPACAPMSGMMKSASRPVGAARAIGGGVLASDRAEIAAKPAVAMESMDKKKEMAKDGIAAGEEQEQPGEPEAAATVRTQFADTALWIASFKTNHDGLAETTITMPENLTGWKIRAWAMGHGTKVAESTAEAVTRKNLLLRLQAPRFFTEKDEVVLSANIHNYLSSEKSVRAVLELGGGALEPIGAPEQTVKIPAGGEQRVDWRVKAVREGEAVVRMKALTSEESDAMEMKFPVQVHGMDKMQARSGYLAPDKSATSVTFEVPADHRPETARLEIRYSPTLAGAMVDALPYLVDYPYGCTEQTLSRFLPTVITQRVLQRMGIPLEEIRKKRSNLNAQELGDDKERAKQWQRYKNPDGSFKNPVFDEDEVRLMSLQGVRKLTEMQLTDGGWGWFSGYGEHSWPHTTAWVVHGLQIARENDLKVGDTVLKRGIDWLTDYQARQVTLLKNWESKSDIPKKRYADNLDAFIFMVLTDAGIQNDDMRKFLYRDRGELAVYGKSMLGIALHKLGRAEERDMVIQNIEQFLVKDAENQTAYLNLGNGGYWWYWYGSEYEAHAYYLKLLAKTGRVGDWKAPYLVKYLLNNRKHATCWNSTRDTALVVEAFADYLKASKEDKPDLTVTLKAGNGAAKTVKINGENLFSFDNKFVLEGKDVATGANIVEIRKEGTGPLYLNAYCSYFSLEDFITSAGLEVKVKRNVYKLTEADKKIKVAGARGQALDQKVEKYERVLLDNNAVLKSGDLVEVELVLESKNDYEYLIFEDMKAAGFEPVEVRSGYTGNEMGAYVEFRDNRVAFFVRQLARGKHSVSYRLRAETPGKFSALPARGYAMYAPELRGNSDEIKINIAD